MFSILQLGSAGVAALPASADAWRVHIDSMDNLNACVSDAAKGAAWFVLARKENTRVYAPCHRTKVEGRASWPVALPSPSLLHASSITFSRPISVCLLEAVIFYGLSHST